MYCPCQIWSTWGRRKTGSSLHFYIQTLLFFLIGLTELSNSEFICRIIFSWENNKATNQPLFLWWTSLTHLNANNRTLPTKQWHWPKVTAHRCSDIFECYNTQILPLGIRNTWKYIWAKAPFSQRLVAYAAWVHWARHGPSRVETKVTTLLYIVSSFSFSFSLPWTWTTLLSVVPTDTLPDV